MKAEKRINKRLIGAVIGSAILGLSGLSMTPKGQGVLRRFRNKCKRLVRFLGAGYRELMGTRRKK